MPITDSPLRYPGGKSQLKKFVSELLLVNDIENGTYIEPFAGGAGLAISLLLEEKVSKIVINDYDISIWAIWKSILDHYDTFVAKIDSTPITIEEWHNQKQMLLELSTAPLIEENIVKLGFAAFFLNRTNVSGIIKGGPIGGLQQNGNYLIDCRFNKKNLISKMKKIHNLRDSITLYNLDAVEFINTIIPTNDADSTLIFFDPPYYKKGPNLYRNFYTHDNHVELALAIQSLKDNKWLTTYDTCNEIIEMYNDSYGFEYALTYSLATKRKATESMFFSGKMKHSYDFDNLFITRQY